MYLNYLQLAFLTALILVVGVAAGILFEQGKKIRRSRRHKSPMVEISPELLACVLADPNEAGAALRDALAETGDASCESELCGCLVQGILYRQSGSPQKALALHQSLLAKPDLNKGATGLIRLQCALDLYAQNRYDEAHKMLHDLPKRWKSLSSVKALQERVDSHLHRAKK